MPARTNPKSKRTGNDALKNTLPGVALVLASVLPAALSTSPVSPPPAGSQAVSTATCKDLANLPKGRHRKNSASMKNLIDWAKAVVVTVDGVSIEDTPKRMP